MALEQMLCEIKTGFYSPDEIRSGRIRTQPEIAISAVIEVKDEALGSGQVHSASQDVNEIEESSDSSSTSDSDEEDDYEPRGYDTKMFSAPEAPEGFALWQHSKSRVLHLMANNYSKSFCFVVVLLVISMSTAVSSLDMIHPYAVCVSQERNLTDSSVKEICAKPPD